MKIFYDRLVTAGKPKCVAHAVVDCKLVILAHALVRHQTDYDPAFSAIFS